MVNGLYVAGEFFKSRTMVFIIAGTEMFGLLWGVFNWVFLTKLAKVLRPRPSTSERGKLQLIQPSLYDEGAVDSFVSSPTGMIAAMAIWLLPDSLVGSIGKCTTRQSAATYPLSMTNS